MRQNGSRNIYMRRQLLAAARRGTPEAQYALASDYDFGRPRDLERAVRWYRRAAEQGHGEAQNLLGECLREGEGAQKSLREAVHWFRQAASQNVSDAQVSLGYAFFYGEGVRRNRSEALRWYQAAAAQGNASAHLNIGHMFLR